MKTYKIKELLYNYFNGEWGADASGDKGIKVIRTTNFTNDGELDFSDIVYRNIGRDHIGSKHLKVGDIILERSGGGPNQPVGRVAFFNESIHNGLFLSSNFTTVLRPNTTIVLPKYLHYILFYFHLSQRTLRHQNKTNGIINLKFQNYLNDVVTIEENQEKQLQSIYLLDKAKSLINERKVNIARIDDILRAQFLNVFGDPVGNRMKIEKISLSKVSNVMTGNTPPRSNKAFYGDYIEWIKTDNINNDGFFPTKAKEYLSMYGIKKGRKVGENCLLVCCIAGSAASIGSVVLTDRPLAFNQQINAVVPNTSIIDPFYLYGFFKVNKLYVQSFMKKGMKKMISKSTLEKIPILLPSLTQQKEFGQLTQKLINIKSDMQMNLDQLEDLFHCILQNTFGTKDNLQLSKKGLKKIYLLYSATTQSSSIPLSSGITKDIEPFVLRHYKDTEDFEEGAGSFKEKTEEEMAIIHKKATDLEYYIQNKSERSASNADSNTVSKPINKRKFSEGEALSILNTFREHKGGFRFQTFSQKLVSEQLDITYQEIKNLIFRQLEDNVLTQIHRREQMSYSREKDFEADQLDPFYHIYLCFTNKGEL